MFQLRNSELGVAMMQAHEVAAELGHPEIGPDHILLGLTTNLRGSVQPLLAEHGLSYAAARAIVIAQHGDDASKPDNESDDGPPTTDLDDDREALASIGIDLDKVTEAVGETFGEDITRAWGRRRERAERDTRRGQRDEEHPRRGPGPGMPPPPPGFGGFAGFPDFSDFPGLQDLGPFGGPRGRGRRGPHSRRFGRGPGLSPATAAILHSLRSQAQEARTTGARSTEEEDRRPGRGQFQAMFRPERIVLAIMDSPDPATRAMLEAMTGTDGLRAQLQERLAAEPAA